MALDEPIFFDTDSEKLVAELKSDYEARVNFPLSPAQSEMLLIQSFAYRFQLTLIQANEAAKQNLLAFAKYPMLDYLGEWLGVERLPASSAKCTIRFNLIEGHPAISIPKGIRVQSIDGKVVFITLEDIEANLSDEFVTVLAECTNEGEIGNNYSISEIGVILDPQAYVSTALNVGITNGGTDAESDDRLRERIRLAPSSFSCAGPRGAYIFFAKSAHNSIIDVGINSPTPGTVAIYPLLENAVTPSTEIINAVYAICNDDKVRPLSDTVLVYPPTKKIYSISVNLILLSGADSEMEKKKAEDSLKIYADDKKSKLGLDVVISQISAAASSKNVYKVQVTSPVADVTAAITEVSFCSGITVNVTGFSDE
ncbi:baseplate J/gp47 family protein [Pedobacter sp. Hv1]|uniref:baseplate assembly protein n=1 Tax=Pedobacter sp. Hv1 TaxID=1740090 RepID=UPI0006D8A375|nr:baseplate J/gp47 family protein [Pedobacter sp. Hv1]KQC02105.1 hypothetical protein AQF98_00590 [Pedobacter sp. Hv1]